MYIWIYLSAAVALGIVIALQPLLNAILARATNSPITAATISNLVAFLGSLVLFGLGDRGDTGRAALASVP